jgi:hypothetical protein
MRIAYETFPEGNQQALISIGILPKARDLPADSNLINCLQSFHGAIGWQHIADINSQASLDCEFFLHEVASDRTRVAFPSKAMPQNIHWLEIRSVTEEGLPATPSLLHTILAPAFVSGLVRGSVSFDWDDIKYILGTGDHGLLAITSGPIDDAMKRAQALISSELDRSPDSVTVTGVIWALFVPGGGPTMQQIKHASGLVRGIATTDAARLCATPGVVEGHQMSALLVVISATES